MLFSILLAATMSVCFESEAKAVCCPSACHVYSTPRWPVADDVLRGCYRGLGCDDEGRTVRNTCGCK